MIAGVVRGRSGVENIGTGNSRGHDERDFGEVCPALVTERFGPRVLLDIIIPGRRRMLSDTGTCFIIPDPARN